MIQATPMALASVGEDRIAWSASPQVNFDLKSAYKMAMGDELTISVSINWIWKLDILPRIQTFVLMCAYNIIGVRDYLRRKGLMKVLGSKELGTNVLELQCVMLANHD